MRYYIKHVLFGYVYLILMGTVAFGVTFIQSRAAQIVLGVLTIGFFCLVMWLTMFKEGESALDVRHSNDIERRRMIETGNIRPIRTAEEYKPYKGFLVGVFICLPLIIAMLVHLILGFALKGANGGGMVGCLMYLPFYIVYGVFKAGTGIAVTWGEYFIILYAIPVVSAATGIPYMMGARKSQSKYDMIAEKQRLIYGDDQINDDGSKK